MKSLYDIVSDALARRETERDSDSKLQRELRDLCWPKRDAGWTVDDAGRINLPDRLACHYSVKAGKITVRSPNRLVLGEFDNPNAALGCIGEAIAAAIEQHKSEQVERLERDNMRSAPLRPPLYPAVADK
jgi:hypothetical protein